MKTITIQIPYDIGDHVWFIKPELTIQKICSECNHTISETAEDVARSAIITAYDIEIFSSSDEIEIYYTVKEDYTNFHDNFFDYELYATVKEALKVLKND
jgi:hypothetical protein